jgi:tRNA (guanine37-N1)-methyltransferase
MKFNIVTIFPQIIQGYASESILGRAQKNKLIDINPVSLRDFTEDKHKSVDDTPYGGGPGMVMKPEPIYKALKSIDAIPFRKADGLSKMKKIFTGDIKKKKRTVLLSPRGRQFDQRLAEEWSALSELTFVCGRYEGVDQRVADHMVDEEVSIGPYVLAGGELGALVMIEAVSRLIPGVLGNIESLAEETHGIATAVEYPQYTKPADFLGWNVPDILLSGDHKKIEAWRKNSSS